MSTFPLMIAIEEIIHHLILYSKGHKLQCHQGPDKCMCAAAMVVCSYREKNKGALLSKGTHFKNRSGQIKQSTRYSSRLVYLFCYIDKGVIMKLKKKLQENSPLKKIPAHDC